MAVSFKKCEPADLSTLVAIAKDTFIAAFEKVNNPNDFNTYVASAFSEKTMRKQLNNPNSLFYFIYDDDTLVGYFKMNENDAQNERFNEPSIELERLYILSDFQGKQIGSEALQKTIQIAKTKNVSFLWLGVWEHNHAAFRFYERYGFIKFGSHPYMLGSDEQTDWMMKYELS